MGVWGLMRTTIAIAGRLGQLGLRETRQEVSQSGRPTWHDGQPGAGHNLKPVLGKIAAGKDVIRSVGPCLTRTTLTRPSFVRLINTRARFIIRAFEPTFDSWLQVAR